jgi:hypothetical protein
LGEKWVPFFEIGLSGKTETFCGEISEAIDLGHEYPRSSKRIGCRFGDSSRLSGSLDETGYLSSKHFT